MHTTLNLWLYDLREAAVPQARSFPAVTRLQSYYKTVQSTKVQVLSCSITV